MGRVVELQRRCPAHDLIVRPPEKNQHVDKLSPHLGDNLSPDLKGPIKLTGVGQDPLNSTGTPLGKTGTSIKLCRNINMK